VRCVPLGSGSRGNATLVELKHARLLVDAGLSARTLTRRLELVGVRPTQIDAILLSHEHQDHASGVERFSKRHGIPVVCAVATLEALDLAPQHLGGWVPLPEDGRVAFGPVEVQAFPVPHDAAAPVGYVITGDGLRLGFATDLGHVTTLVLERLRGCHLLFVESNYDPQMLQGGSYPWSIKQRVAGRMGHLSNAAAAAVIRNAVDDACQAVVLAHLSENNNRPQLARRAVARPPRRWPRRDGCAWPCAWRPRAAPRPRWSCRAAGDAP